MRPKRTSDRRKVFYYLEVEDIETEQILGRLGDISPDGIMLLADKTLPLERVYNIAIHLPKNSSFEREKMELAVETRWLKPDYNSSILCIGCKFVDAEPEKDSIFEKLIEYYGFSDGYKNFKPPQ